MHKIFTSALVRPLLPAYYAAPADVRVERQILENLRSELQRIKNPNSSGKLARKRSLLEVVVSDIEVDLSRIHLILGTKKCNVVGAVERLQTASEDSDGRFCVPARRKRQGGISDDVKEAVRAWWTNETRVSPNRKDIRRKRVGCNVYDRHPAHLLLETQVQQDCDPSSFYAYLATHPVWYFFGNSVFQEESTLRQPTFLYHS